MPQSFRRRPPPRSRPASSPRRPRARPPRAPDGSTRVVTAPWTVRHFSYAVDLTAGQNVLVTKAAMFGFLVAIPTATGFASTNAVPLWTAAKLVAVKMTPVASSSVTTSLAAWNFQWLGNQSTVQKIAYSCPSSVVRSFTERPARNIRPGMPISTNAPTTDLAEEMFEISLDENNSSGAVIVGQTLVLRVDVTIMVQGMNESGTKIALTASGAGTFTANSGLFSLPLDAFLVAAAHAQPAGAATPIGIPAYFDNSGHTNYGMLLTSVPK